MNLENDLRRAFQRKPAPPDLADRVLARVAQGDISGDNTASGRLPPSPQSGFGAASKPAPAYVGARARMPLASPTCPPQLQRRRKLREGGVVRWLAAAAALTLIAAGGARYYVYQQDVAEAEQVQAEIRVALQITGEKLALVQRKVQDAQR